MRVLQKDWSPDSASLELLLFALDADRELAGVRYEQIRKTLVRFFSGRGSLLPEDHADEVFNRVARKLSEGVHLELRENCRYFMQVARFVLSEYFKTSRRKFVPLDELEPSNQPGTDPLAEAEELRERIKRELGLSAVTACRMGLKQSERETLDIYDRGQGREKIDNRNDLAKHLGKSKAALIVEISRIRTKIKKCVMNKLRELGILGV